MKPVSDLLDHLRDLFHYVQIEVAITTPLSLGEGGAGEADTPLGDIATTVVELEFEDRLSLHGVVGVRGFVFEVRVELMEPFLEDAKEHDGVGVFVVVVVALEFG